MIEKIRKRSGEIVKFDSAKIREAIRKAALAVGSEDINDETLDMITAHIISAIPTKKIPNVEQIQDLVEENLIKSGYTKTAKAYILYRAEHAKIRQTETDLMDIYKELTFASAEDADIKRENANIDADTAMGTMLKYGSEGAKYFVDNYILPKDIASAHLNGEIHIHDKDFYMLTETCCQINLLDLFKDGFSTGHGYLREPNSIESYSALACIAIQANQNEMHGGQSVPNFDYCMAPGVAKTFKKKYFIALARYFSYVFDLSLEEGTSIVDRIKNGIKSEVVMLNMDNVGVELVEFLKDLYTIDEINKAHINATQTAFAETERATYQSMEAFVHNLNTMNSRAGAQVPFSSINYGTDTSPEARMVIKNLLLATDSGLGNGETPIFPVQIFKVKDGINYKEET